MGSNYSRAASARGFLQLKSKVAQLLASTGRLPVRSRRHGRHSRTLTRALTCSLRGALSLRRGRRLSRNQPQRLAHFGFQLRHNVFVVLQELAGILASLANAFALVAIPGP